MDQFNPRDRGLRVPGTRLENLTYEVNLNDDCSESDCIGRIGPGSELQIQGRVSMDMKP
jgi:hypothetical protein